MIRDHTLRYVVRFLCTAVRSIRIPSWYSGRTLGHAALHVDHTRPTTHAYTSGHTVVVWWHGGVVVPGVAAAAMRCLSLEARLFSRLSSGRVSLSAPSSTPARSFARACVSMADPVVIAATADTVRHSESIVQGAHGGTTHHTRRRAR